MTNKYDVFGNDRYIVRVPFEHSISEFDKTDLENVRSAKVELGGFAGKDISRFMEILGLSEAELRTLINDLNDPSQLDRIPQKNLCYLFVLCNLVCAALGDEELATITGRGRDEYFLTIRRLYHALAKKL